MGEQRVEQTWDLPPQEKLAAITRGHVARLEASDADDAWRANGLPHVVLTSIGRRSGEPRKVALSPWTDPGGRPIVAATSAGHTRDPAWYRNLRDRPDEEVHCRFQDRARWMRPEIVEGEEHERLWELIVADRPFFADYRTRSGRTIPLVRLIEVRPAEP